MNRRDFLKAAGVLGLGHLVLPRAVEPLVLAIEPGPAAAPVHVGLISDLHHLSFNKNEIARFTAFMDAVEKEKPDFILECGDFTYPDGAAALREQINRFSGPFYHVLGNHDMDKCDKAAYLKLWEMDSAYYSFDRGAFHFVVLDRNHYKDDSGKIIPYARANWYKFKGESISILDPEQLQWLRDDLQKTDKPAVLFMHQPIATTNGATFDGNAMQIVNVIDEVNQAAHKSTGRPRVVAVFFGHDHNDLYALRHGVHYVMINSASYAYRAAPWYYADPLFAFATFDPAGTITLAGRATHFNPDPKMPAEVERDYDARISDRQLKTA